MPKFWKNTLTSKARFKLFYIEDHLLSFRPWARMMKDAIYSDKYQKYYIFYSLLKKDKTFFKVIFILSNLQ